VADPTGVDGKRHVPLGPGPRPMDSVEAWASGHLLAVPNAGQSRPIACG
jgi:hypothetical protein